MVNINPVNGGQTDKVYGWMKPKNGQAKGFYEHNKHYLDFKAKQDDADAQQETATVDPVVAQEEIAQPIAVTQPVIDPLDPNADQKLDIVA